MVVVENKVWNHSQVDESVVNDLTKVSSGFLDSWMDKIIQQGVHGNIIHLLGAIRLEDKEHVNFMIVWRNGVESFRHGFEKMRILVNIVGQEETGPVPSIVRSQILGTFDRVNLESS